MRKRKRIMQGKIRQEQYDSEEDALQVVEELQKKSSYKFVVQHSIMHKSKWVIVECYETERSTE